MVEGVVGVVDIWPILLSKWRARVVEVACFHDGIEIHEVYLFLCIAVIVPECELCHCSAVSI